jgi:CheY-like chemotaxis protein
MKTQLNLKSTSSKLYRILIVDDDKDICTLIKKSLIKNGFELVETAHSAEEAAEKIGFSLDSETPFPNHKKYRLIITDIMLDGVNGFSLCKNIKKFFPDSFVMLMSGYDISAIYEKITESSADDFIAKPFNMYELITRVNMILKRDSDIKSLIPDNYLKSKAKVPYINDIVDSYLIVDFIAYGKSTLIFKTINLDDGAFYAMKILSPVSNNFDELVKRFEEEIEIMSDLDHPNIIKFYKKGYYKNLVFLVMEYFDGVDLEELLIAKGRLNEKLLYSIAFDLACSISAVHSKQIVHRDIKLKNLIFSFSHNQVKLCDFGISQHLEQNELPITQDGIVIGTPLYMAPEIFVGKHATISSDIYSYGSTLYHLATNSPPFVANSYPELLALKHECKLPSISTIRPEFSSLWDDLIIKRCLAPEVNDRPNSMNDILSFLIKLKENIF